MEQNSIDVKALLLKLWANKYIFLIVWVATAIVTYGITFLVPTKWEAKTEFVENFNFQEWKNLQTIAWNRNMQTSVAPSGSVYNQELYPTMVESAAYLNRLMATPLKSAEGRTVQQVLLRRDTVAPHPEQLVKMRDMIVCKENNKTDAMYIKVTAFNAAQAAEIATVARMQLADLIAADRREKQLSNLHTYEACREDNLTAQMLYDITRMDMERQEPVFAVVSEAEEAARPVSPRRVRITLLVLVLVTLCMTGWYWRKDIPEWL